MNSLLAILLPVALFAAQAWFAVALDLTEVLGVYQVFLVSYLVGAGVGVARPPREQARDELAPSFDAFARNFIWAKVVLTIYFALIFLGYVRQGGFASVRHFMTSEEIQTSPFYFPPFMYVDAYLMYPLNYIVLVALFLRRNWKYFLVLLCSILLHNAVFYAGRTVFYNLLMLALFGALYRRESVLKTLAGVTAAAVIGLSATTILLFQRDDRFEYEGVSSLAETFTIGVVNYHVVPPLILDAISRDSSYFKSHTGYGLATFGFLVDPLISVMPVEGAKSLMASKVLSAEAQAFTISVDESEYNAFATFLYAAVFDFGRIAGPALYGLLFGFLIGSTLRRRDAGGFLVFVVVAYFVYFNSFTCFITGDWFWAIGFVAVFFREQAPDAVGELAAGAPP